MHASATEVPVVAEAMGVISRQATWGSHAVAFEHFPAGLDTAPIFVGLPDDRCQCPHWGYVVSGSMRVSYSDRDEVIGAGEAYVLEPGHSIAYLDDTDVIEFSPAGEYGRTMEVVGRNVAMMAGARANQLI